MRNQLTAPLILSIRQLRFWFQIFNWQKAWKIGWVKTWNGGSQNTFPGLFTVFHHPFCKHRYSVQQHGRCFKSQSLSLTALPRCNSQVWNRHLLQLAWLLLQINKDRAEGRLRGEIAVLFSRRDGQASPRAAAKLRLMPQLVMAAESGQRQSEAGVCGYSVLHKSGSLAGLWSEKKINLPWPIDLSVKWKYSQQMRGWKASSKWSNLDPQSLPQSEHQPTATILPSAGLPPFVPHSPCKRCCIFRQPAYCESCCGIQVLCFSLLFLLFKAILFVLQYLEVKAQSLRKYMVHIFNNCSMHLFVK